MHKVNSGTAYILWCLWIFGFGGAQRLYTGHIASGLLYLFTWGLFGIGQVIDLALIPGMVDKRNIYLRGLAVGNTSADVNPLITLNIGEIPNLKQIQANNSQVSVSKTPIQKLLKAAKENGGLLSLAQATMYTELEPQEVKKLLFEAEKNGLAEITNDPNTGAIRYRFDV